MVCLESRFCCDSFSSFTTLTGDCVGKEDVKAYKSSRQRKSLFRRKLCMLEHNEFTGVLWEYRNLLELARGCAAGQGNVHEALMIAAGENG